MKIEGISLDTDLCADINQCHLCITYPFLYISSEPLLILVGNQLTIENGKHEINRTNIKSFSMYENLPTITVHIRWCFRQAYLTISTTNR